MPATERPLPHDLAELRSLKPILRRPSLANRGPEAFSKAAALSPIAIPFFAVMVITFLLLQEEPPSRGLKVLLHHQTGCPHQNPIHLRIAENRGAEPNLYLNFRPASWTDLQSQLFREIATRQPGCPVYVEGGKDLEFRTVIRAIDTIRGLHVDVVLSTKRQP
jgi:biopolymer transport protein ExbD